MGSTIALRIEQKKCEIDDEETAQYREKVQRHRRQRSDRKAGSVLIKSDERHVRTRYLPR